MIIPLIVAAHVIRATRTHTTLRAVLTLAGKIELGTAVESTLSFPLTCQWERSLGATLSQVDTIAWCASGLLRRMTRKTVNAAILMFLFILWTSRNNLRTVEGLFLQVRHNQGYCIYTQFTQYNYKI